MFHKVKEVTSLPGFTLDVLFVDGERKKYNMRPLFNKIEDFKVFETIPGLFEQVRVDAGGYGVAWNDWLDLSCDELYFNGTNF